jgi:hypothetical protein
MQAASPRIRYFRPDQRGWVAVLGDFLDEPEYRMDSHFQGCLMVLLYWATFSSTSPIIRWTAIVRKRSWSKGELTAMGCSLGCVRKKVSLLADDSDVRDLEKPGRLAILSHWQIFTGQLFSASTGASSPRETQRFIPGSFLDQYV